MANQKPIGNVPAKPAPKNTHQMKYDKQREAEIAVGQARIKFHEDRERMIAAKRAREDEGADVSAAKAANSVL